MADRSEVHVWTIHSQEQSLLTPHAVQEDIFLRKKLRESVPNQSGAIVVDFGCGSGLWRHLFDGYSYIGVDQNAGMIQVGKDRRLQDATFQQIEWNKLPFADGSVDLIFSSAVIQHNTHVDKEPVLREFHRVLKPGGFYLCTENTFRKDNYHISFPTHKKLTPDMSDGYSFTPTGWQKFMKPFGFEQLEFSEPSEYLYKKV